MTQEDGARRGNHVEISAGRILPPLSSDAPILHRVVRTIVRLSQGLYYHDATAAAPAMAFQFFLSLVPLLVVFGYIVGHFVRLRGVDGILAPLLGTAPDVTQNIVRRELERLGGSSAAPAPLAVLGFLWLASSGTHGFMDALERAVHAPRRPYWKKRLLSVGWVFLVLAILSVTGWALVQWDDVVRGMEAPEVTTPEPTRASPSAAPSAQDRQDRQDAQDRHDKAEPSRPARMVAMAHSFTKRKILRGSDVQQRFTLGIALFVATCTLAAFYRYGVERPREIKRVVWPGATLAIVGWLVLSWLFSVYVTSLGRYALYYGSLAAVAVLLVWFWLSSLALLVGAELNAQLEGIRD